MAGWPLLPLGFGLDGRLLLGRRGRVCVLFIIIVLNNELHDKSARAAAPCLGQAPASTQKTEQQNQAGNSPPPEHAVEGQHTNHAPEKFPKAKEKKEKHAGSRTTMRRFTSLLLEPQSSSAAAFLLRLTLSVSSSPSCSSMT